MSNIVKDIKDNIIEHADDNLVEGGKVLSEFVNDSISENLNEDLISGSHAITDFVRDTADELNKHKKQTTAAVAIAATIAAGGIGADVDTDIVTSYTTMHAPHQVVLDISEPPAVDLDDEDEDKKSSQEASITANAESYIGQTIAKVIVTPIYMVGSAILYVLKGIFGLIVAPVLTVVLKWAIMATVILGALAIAFKTAFPDIPLRKLLNKKCVSFVLVAVAVISAVCEILTLVAPQIGVWIEVIRITFGLVVMLLIFITVMRVFGKKKTVQAEV